jgi:predicted Ser/Thr protein kinase
LLQIAKLCLGLWFVCASCWAGLEVPADGEPRSPQVCAESIFQTYVNGLMAETKEWADRYTILSELGGDASSTLFLAEDRTTLLKWVLKASPTPSVSTQFRTEVDLAIRAGTEGIGPKAQWVDRLAALGMQYVDGATFDVAARAVAPENRGKWLDRVLSGLVPRIGLLHEMLNVPHGAILPRHVFVAQDGRVWLLDFSTAAQQLSINSSHYLADYVALSGLVKEVFPTEQERAAYFAKRPALQAALDGADVFRADPVEVGKEITRALSRRPPSAMRRWVVAAVIGVPLAVHGYRALGEYLWPQPPTPQMEATPETTPAYRPPTIPFGDNPDY